MSQSALQRAIDIAGGQKPLAERIGTTQSMVWYWLRHAKRGLPAERAIAIEEATGIPRHELCPRVFAKPQPEKVVA